MKGLKIGISVGMQKPNETVWTNGIKQNVLNFADLLLRSKLGHEVALINTCQNADYGKIDWDTERFQLFHYNEMFDLNLDLMVWMGAQVDDAFILKLKEKGVKQLFYKCGNEWIISTENVLFNHVHRPEAPGFSELYDEFWMIPQLMYSAKGFLQTMHRIEPKEVPFVWSPMHIDRIIETNGHTKEDYLYKPSRGRKRVSIMEPNLNVVKNCIFPMMVAEQHYRDNPDVWKHLYIVNAYKLREHREFKGLVNKLDLQKDKLLSVEQRFTTPMFLKEYTDVVLSWQWENPLNYSYLDTLYLEYPLVHNAYMIKNAGYYYKGFDHEGSKEQLEFALSKHDNNISSYKYRIHKVLKKFRSDNMALVEKYDTLLKNLFK